jgi:hypothetical protein
MTPWPSSTVTLRGLMTGELDTKAAAQIIYGIQQIHLAR